MADTYAYSFDKPKRTHDALIDEASDKYPQYEFDGMTDSQIENMLTDYDAQISAQGVDLDADDEIIPDVPVEVSESLSEAVPASTLTTAEARSLLAANGVEVGKRGRLSPDQWAKANALASAS